MGHAQPRRTGVTLVTCALLALPTPLALAQSGPGQAGASEAARSGAKADRAEAGSGRVEPSRAREDSHDPTSPGTGPITRPGATRPDTVLDGPDTSPYTGTDTTADAGRGTEATVGLGGVPETEAGRQAIGRLMGTVPTGTGTGPGPGLRLALPSAPPTGIPELPQLAQPSADDDGVPGVPGVPGIPGHGTTPSAPDAQPARPLLQPGEPGRLPKEERPGQGQREPQREAPGNHPAMPPHPPGERPGQPTNTARPDRPGTHAPRRHEEQQRKERERHKNRENRDKQNRDKQDHDEQDRDREGRGEQPRRGDETARRPGQPPPSSGSRPAPRPSDQAIGKHDLYESESARPEESAGARGDRDQVASQQSGQILPVLPLGAGMALMGLGLAFLALRLRRG